MAQPSLKRAPRVQIIPSSRLLLWLVAAVSCALAAVVNAAAADPALIAPFTRPVQQPPSTPPLPLPLDNPITEVSSSGADAAGCRAGQARGWGRIGGCVCVRGKVTPFRATCGVQLPLAATAPQPASLPPSQLCSPPSH